MTLAAAADGDLTANSTPLDERTLPAWRLPLPLTPLYGREHEIERVAGLIERDGARLVTLTGPGGVGKTRLAIAVASRLQHHVRDEVLFAQLASVQQPQRVVGALVQAMRLPERPAMSQRDVLFEALAASRALLVLDNFEQVVSAAPFIVECLEACPNLTVLVTSRAVLRVSGEHAFTVPTLGHPNDDVQADPERLLGYPAVRLFVDRARARSADFALTPENAADVAAICRQLDGLPLAIELAAARAAHLSPKAIRARLAAGGLPLLTSGARDQPARLQTMRNAIAWSYDDLSPEEQAVFRRLSIFPTAFDLDGAEWVAMSAHWTAQPDENAPATLGLAGFDDLASLVDKSLLQRGIDPDGEPRYCMLQTIRVFGEERLAAAQETDVARAWLVDWAVAVIERGEPHFTGPEEARWMARAFSEVETFRFAICTAIETGSAELALRMGAGLWALWCFGGLTSDGRTLLRQALAMPGVEAYPGPLARAWIAYGLTAWTQGDIEEARAAYEESLRVAISIDDRASISHAYLRLSQIARHGRDLDGMRRTAEAAIAAGTPDAQTPWTASAQAQLGIVAMLDGRYDDAATLLCEAERVHRAVGYQSGHVWTMQLLADLALIQGDLQGAAGWHFESLPMAASIQNGWSTYEGLIGMARLARETGRSQEAAVLLGAADQVQKRFFVVSRMGPGAHQRFRSELAGELGDEVYAESLAKGAALPTDRALATAMELAEQLQSSEPVAPRQGTPAGPLGLTRRELDVLRLLVEGASNPEIGQQLFISRKTVEHHITGILTKLGVKTRAAAVSRAIRDQVV